MVFGFSVKRMTFFRVLFTRANIGIFIRDVKRIVLGYFYTDGDQATFIAFFVIETNSIGCTAEHPGLVLFEMAHID
tara:strand:- start:3080 stop:3307 length:228 start_codon:yes stop_codon:yes gene_type:complete